MRNEQGHWPEVCKKAFQAMVSDMQGTISHAFFLRYSIMQLRALSPRELEISGRLNTPLFAAKDSTHYQPIAWEEAYSKIAEKLKAIDPKEAFFYASGRSSNEAGFLLQLFARIYGTNHVNNCSYYCHQASGVGLTASIGTGAATVTVEDIDKADTFFLIGCNPASNHPRLLTALARLRRRGGNIIVINPVREMGLMNFRVPSNLKSLLFGSSICSLFLQPKIGGDIAILSGIAKVIINNGLSCPEFIDKATENFSDYAKKIDALTWKEIEESSGLSQQEISAAAKIYGSSKRAIFS